MDDNTRFLKALIQQDWDTYEQLVADFEAQGKGTPVAIIGSAFHLAVLDRFGARRDAGDVIQFVADARVQLNEGRDLPVKEAESLIFATLDMDLPGVAETVDELDLGIIAEIEGQLLFKLLHDRSLSERELDEFLLQAERLAAQAMADGS